MWGVGAPKPHVVQSSTVFYFHSVLFQSLFQIFLLFLAFGVPVCSIFWFTCHGLFYCVVCNFYTDLLFIGLQRVGCLKARYFGSLHLLWWWGLGHIKCVGEWLRWGRGKDWQRNFACLAASCHTGLCLRVTFSEPSQASLNVSTPQSYCLSSVLSYHC